MRKRLFLFGLTALLALLLGYVAFTPLQAVNLVHHVGYWLLLLTVAWFCWLCGVSLRDSWSKWREVRKWALPVVFILAVGGWMQTQEERGFKILADEVLLSSTAMQMHYHRETSVVLRGYEYAGNFTALTVFLDKRPLLFPFLLCTIHDLTGYRVDNVFVLNALLGVALVALLFLLGRRFGGDWAGYAAVLLFCSVPLVQQNATGGGFELLNIVMLLITLLLGLRYINVPTDASLGAFILSGVLLAQVRYESVAFVLPVGATVFYGWWRQRRIEIPWALIAAPLLLVIWPLHHNVFKLSQASWQMFDIAGATTPFGFQYFYDNVAHALNFFFTFDGSQPSAWPMAVLGMLSVGLFVMLLYKQHRAIWRDQPELMVATLFFFGLVIHTTLMLCYFWGRWDDPVIRRLSLPAHVLFVLATLLVWPNLVKRASNWKILTAIGALSFVVITIPASAMHRFSQENFAARTNQWLAEYIRSRPDKRLLAIDNNAGLQWFLYKQSSINPARMAESWEGYVKHFKWRTFDEYLIVQLSGIDLTNGNRLISWEDNFGDALELELIEEKAMSPLYLVRLSRVKAVNEEKLKAWAEERLRINRDPKKTPVPMPTGDADLLGMWVKNLP